MVEIGEGEEVDGQTKFFRPIGLGKFLDNWPCLLRFTASRVKKRRQVHWGAGLTVIVNES